MKHGLLASHQSWCVGEKDDDTHGQRPASAIDARHAAPPLRLSILFVDDSEDTRNLYATFLEWHKHRVVTAEDGVSALQALLHERFDAIVLDLAMPRLTGWEMLEVVRRDPRTRSVPVLVLSGQRERESALRAGADAYCEKPCLPDALLLEIQRTIRGSMKRR